MTARLYIVENHSLVREVIAATVARIPEVEVVGAAESAEEALTAIARELPDLVIVDLSLPDMNGLDLIREVTARYPDVKCLVLTGHRGEAYRARAREVGSRGFVLKDAPEDLPAAIGAVLAGRRFESPDR